MAPRKNQSANKQEEILKKYLRESGEDFTTNIRDNVNWATGDEVASLKKPTAMDYFREIRDKTTSPISEEVIVIEENQNALNLIFRNALNIRDMGNPLYGEQDKSTRKNLSLNIAKADPAHNKVCVIYGGDLLGTEWELKRLNNAKIITESTTGELREVASEVLGDDAVKGVDDPTVIKKALFFALGEKVKVLRRDIKYALSHNVDVYLINGAQEEKINKYFKINVLRTVIQEIDHPRLHLIEGVNTVVNVAKITKGNNRRYATIGFLTNNSISKARQGQQSVAGVKLNSGENNADVVFVTNTNVAGKKGTNQYYVSGESTYITMAQKKMPLLSPKHYNTFSLRIPKTHEITVVEGHNMPTSVQLEKDIYDEFVKQELIKKQIAATLQSQLDQITKPAHTADPVKTVQYFKNRYKSTTSTAVAESSVETVVNQTQVDVAAVKDETVVDEGIVVIPDDGMGEM